MIIDTNKIEQAIYEGTIEHAAKKYNLNDRTVAAYRRQERNIGGMKLETAMNIMKVVKNKIDEDKYIRAGDFLIYPGAVVKLYDYIYKVVDIDSEIITFSTLTGTNTRRELVENINRFNIKRVYVEDIAGLSEGTFMRKYPNTKFQNYIIFKYCNLYFVADFDPTSIVYVSSSLEEIIEYMKELYSFLSAPFATTEELKEKINQAFEHDYQSALYLNGDLTLIPKPTPLTQEELDNIKYPFEGFFDLK